MNWFIQDRFVGSFLGALGVATLFSLWFLFYEKSQANEAQSQLESTVAELNRLRSSSLSLTTKI